MVPSLNKNKKIGHNETPVEQNRDVTSERSKDGLADLALMGPGRLGIEVGQETACAIESLVKLSLRFSNTHIRQL